MAQIRKVLHVEFREPIEGKKHYYFGSKVAIYQRFSADEVGIKYSSLRNIGLEESPYINKNCIIRQGELIAAQSNKMEE